MINNELIKLQDELSNLESAVSHISKAEKLSNNVVESAKMIQEDFARKLDELVANYNEYMSRTSSNTEDNISELTNTHLKLVDEVHQVTDDYSKLSESTLALSEKIESINFPSHLSHIEMRTDEVKSMLADTILSQEASSSDLKSAINKDLDNFMAKQYEISEQIKKIDSIIAKNTKKQTEEIASIQKTVATQSEDYKLLTELFKKQTAQMVTLKIFSIASFVLVAAYFVILMIK